MSKKIIIGNWKMNPSSLKEAKKIFGAIQKTAKKTTNAEVVICPPFVYLSAISHQPSAIKLGAQDIFYGGSADNQNTDTGEISATMLKNLGVQYVMVGHSERREKGETDDVISKKIKTALNVGFKVIFCVGEKERDRDGKYLHFIKNQISEGLKNISKNFFKNLIITYEPIWAIGAKAKGAEKPEDVLQMAIYIKKIIFSLNGIKNIPVLYGGSVNGENARNMLENGGVQGLLVGRSSLDPKEFKKILLSV